MKAFRGCVNQNCVAYKKIRFKDGDDYCTKCGEKLQYVCADCWKQLENNKERYCIVCKALRDDKSEQRIEKAKAAGKAFVAVGPAMVAAAKNVKQIEKAGKTIIEVGGKVVKVIAKK